MYEINNCYKYFATIPYETENKMLSLKVNFSTRPTYLLFSFDFHREIKN